MADVCPTCGAKTPHIRSPDQHKRYFAVLRAAFHHWPEAKDWQFAEFEEFRKHVQMALGYREIAARFAAETLVGTPPKLVVSLVGAAVRAAGAYAVPVVHKGDVVIWRPVSIAVENMGHAKFCELNRALDVWCVDELGVDGDTLLAEMLAAA